MRDWRFKRCVVVLAGWATIRCAYGSVEPPPALKDLERVSLSVVAEVDIPAVRDAEACIEKRLELLLKEAGIELDASSTEYLLISVRGDVRGDDVAIAVSVRLHESVRLKRGPGRIVRAITWQADDVRLVSKATASAAVCSAASELLKVLGVGLYGAQRTVESK